MTPDEPECGHDPEDAVEVTYEDGTCEIFTIVDAFEHDEVEYVLLLSCEQEEGDEEDIVVVAWDDGKLRLLTSEEFDLILPVLKELAEAQDDDDEST